MNLPKNNVELADHFAANGVHLSDAEWLSQTLKPHCKIKRMQKLDRSWRGSRLRILQFPFEFAHWLTLLSSENVRSYLEVGTSTGGSFFTTDSYLRASVSGFSRSIGYDRKAKLRDFQIYQQRFPSCEFRHQGSGDMNLGTDQLDAVFIDARHVEKWVLHDFDKVKNNCRIVGFHDIALIGSTVGLAWNQIKKDHKYFEFIDLSAPVEARCGIGVVMLR